MDTLLIFFAFPLAVIIISAVLERLLRSPIAVAALTFAVFLIVAFAAFDEIFLIAVLAYTIIALITAAIVNFLRRKNRCQRNIYDLLSEIVENNGNNDNNNEANSNSYNTVENLIENTQKTSDYENYNNYNCGTIKNRYRSR